MHPQVPLAFARLAYVELWYNRRRTKALIEELRQMLNERELQLPERIERRIHFYTAVSAVSNHWFGLLRGKGPTPQEDMDGLLFGAVSPVIDDLMDSTDRTFEELEADTRQETAEQVLYHYLMQRLRPLRQINPYFDKYARLTHLAQNESLRQMRPEPMSIEELERISYEKGAYTMLLFRMVLRNPPVDGEEAAIYTLGAMLQLMDDLFDVWNDLQDGSQTLFTNTGDVRAMEARYVQCENRFREQLLGLDLPMAQKRRAYVSIMGVVNRTHVAIHQFNSLKGDSERLNFTGLSRKDLIVDMHRFSNLWMHINWEIRV
jgi:hypothetical protein